MCEALFEGLKEKKVRGDGNCQFRALADQLFRDQAGHASRAGTPPVFNRPTSSARL